jgi:hypothetical protein
MQLIKSKILILCVLALFMVGSTGCSEKGGAEKAGEKIDQALDSAKDKFKEATK